MTMMMMMTMMMIIIIIIIVVMLIQMNIMVMVVKIGHKTIPNSTINSGKWSYSIILQLDSTLLAL